MIRNVVVFSACVTAAVCAAAEEPATWSARISDERSLISFGRGVTTGYAAVLSIADGMCIASISNGGAALSSTCLPKNLPGHFVARNGASFLFGNRIVGGDGPLPGWIGKINTAGQVVWGRQIVAGEPLQLLAADVTGDNGIIVVGSSGAGELGASGTERSLALKLSAIGDVEWAREFDATGYEAFTNVRSVRDGYILRGIDQLGVRVSKLSRDGTMLWSHWFDSKLIGACDVLPDGDVIVVGGSAQAQDGAWIARLAPNGVLRWLERSQGSIRRLNWVAVRPDSTLIAFGAGPTTQTSTTALIAFKPTGELLWQRTIALQPDVSAQDGQLADDGGVVLALVGNNSVELHKFSRNGEPPECLKPVTTMSATTLAKSANVDFSPVTESRPLVVQIADAPAASHPSNLVVTPCVLTARPLTTAQEPVTAEQRAAIERSARVDQQVNELSKRVTGLLSGRKFAELDQLASEYRQSDETYATGLRKLAVFYGALSTAVPELGSEEQHLQLLDDWMRASPRSPTAAVVAAETRIQYAFAARGGSTANAVTSPAWKKYEELLAGATQILTSSAGYAAVDPEYHIARIEIAGGTCANYQNVAFDPRLTHFAYASLWRIAANFLLPRWCGSEERYRKFAERAAEATREQYGEGLYALIANDAVLSEPDRSAVARYKFDWPRIRQGFLDLIRRFPDNLAEYHRLAHLAWFFDDRAVARAMFEKPQIVWTAETEYIWGQRGHYDEVRRWSMSEPAQAVVGAVLPGAAPTKASSLRKQENTSSSWIRAAASQWPELVMRNEIRLQDGVDNEKVLSFLLNAKGGVVAISALTPFATPMAMPAMKDFPSYNIYQPILLDAFRAKLASWTMTAPQDPAKQWSVIAIEPPSRRASDHGHAVVLTLSPARGSLPVRVLSSREEAGLRPTFLRLRVYVVGCGAATNGKWIQTALPGTVTSVQGDSVGNTSSLAVTLDEHVEWSDLIGAPAIDEDGFVVGVVTGPEKGYPVNRRADATYLDVEEIHRVLADAALSPAR